MIKVFITEDDSRVSFIHENFVKNIEGVQIVGQAVNAEETLRKLKEVEVDLLLLDIYLPDMLGTELMLELRKNELKHINVIMITAAKHVDFLEESLNNGIFSYLIKPVTIEKFTEVIESYKKHYKLLKSREFIDQEFIDHLLKSNTNLSSNVKSSEGNLPKGVSPITLEKVIKIIEQFKTGFTTEEIGYEMGASRTTARRYLEYLVSIGKVRAELEYGIVGRPERIYYGK
ncbi:response regulator [Alkalihalobacillus sp. BA299]|uniref:response regulator n=1 Tax=Alkalihalobacillus sp. BA299 TaxID=2815938 RepID=UPI001AD9E2D1|nr:response regulator [Alkalihalobacillus sp. BA299]